MILHSDGAVRKLLPDIVEIDFDVFNPIQPGVPGLDPQEVKDEFGDRLMFWGGIDLSPAVSDKELETEIQEKFRILGRDRGYVIAPTQKRCSSTSSPNISASAVANPSERSIIIFSSFIG